MQKQKAPRLVTVAILTTITIIFWVFTGLYNLITSAPPVTVDPQLLQPIDPTLDTKALSRLNNRVYFEQGETSSPVIVRGTPELDTEIEELSEESEEEPEITPTEVF